MPRKGTMQVNITFRRDEAHLYSWLRSMAREEGVRISDYVKRLIRRDMTKDVVALEIIVKRAFSEWAWCPRCGTHAELRSVEKEPDHIKLVYWCSECGMGYSKTISKGELDSFDKVGEIMSRIAGTIPDKAAEKHEKIKRLTKDDIAKMLV